MLHFIFLESFFFFYGSCTESLVVTMTEKGLHFSVTRWFEIDIFEGQLWQLLSWMMRHVNIT